MKKVRNLMFLCVAMMAACMIQSKDVQATEVGKYEMSDTKSYSKYDVTGDGVPDTVKFEKQLDDDGYNYNAFKVIINGKTALYGDNVYFYTLKPVLIQTEGHQYILISLVGDDDDETKKIYKYVDGQLKECADLDEYVSKIYFHSSVTISSVGTSSITFKVTGQSYMLARTNMSFVYKVGATGELSLADEVTKVTYTKDRVNSRRSYKSKYLVAAKKIQAYSSATGSKKAFRMKKGTKLKITKVSVQGKTPRYYCITKSGKKGWVNSKMGLFKDMPYAG